MGATFTFLPDGHQYIEDGLTRKSVTQRLNESGLVCYAGIPEDVLQRKADIGTAAHLACWYWDEGDLNWDSVDDAVVPYVLGWVKFRKETDFVPRIIERRGIGEMAGVRYGYTLDREGVFNGSDYLIEIKCTAAVEPSWRPQTAAYEHALFKLDGKRRRRIAVHLKPNGNYSLVSMQDVQDYMIFRTVLTHPPGWEQILQNWLELKGRANGSERNYHR